MTGFEYHRPESLAEASRLLGSYKAVALAGGTDLMVGIRHRKVEPEVVVDLKSVAEIGDEIGVVDGAIRIGGRVVMRRLIEDARVRESFPALVESASVVGSVQIRNRATVAGNLCNASPAADTAPALIAHSATVRIAGPGGERNVAVEELFTGPGSTVLERGEVVTAIDVPVPRSPMGSAFARVTRRRGVDLASVSLACVIDGAGAVRFGFGAVGPKPLLGVADVADLSAGGGWEQLFAVTSPITDVRAGADYRRAMLRVHGRRALHEAMRRLERAP
ncbi:MAG: xanthine dehydrogenase family protein subunit M [Acidimicrobiia bacterium]